MLLHSKVVVIATGMLCSPRDKEALASFCQAAQNSPSLRHGRVRPARSVHVPSTGGTWICATPGSVVRLSLSKSPRFSRPRTRVTVPGCGAADLRATGPYHTWSFLGTRWELLLVRRGGEGTRRCSRSLHALPLSRSF